MNDHDQSRFRVLAYVAVVLAFAFTTWRSEVNANRIEDEARVRSAQIEAESESRVRQIERESILRANANCEASNKTSQAIRAFIEGLVVRDGSTSERGQAVLDAAIAQFPVRHCPPPPPE